MTATLRAFRLVRDEDMTGVSGTGVVAEGVVFSDGTVSLRWTSAWPTSVVFHDRGLASVEAVHGHDGKTRVEFVDDSGSSINGERLSWQQLYEHEKKRRLQADKWGVLVSDLDRCTHGRHEGNDCSSCGGPSVGNLLLPTGTEVGRNLSGRPYVVPARRDRHHPEAWEAR